METENIFIQSCEFHSQFHHSCLLVCISFFLVCISSISPNFLSDYLYFARFSATSIRSSSRNLSSSSPHFSGLVFAFYSATKLPEQNILLIPKLILEYCKRGIISTSNQLRNSGKQQLI